MSASASLSQRMQALCDMWNEFGPLRGECAFDLFPLVAEVAGLEARAQDIDYPEFEKFYETMITEMRRHSAERGDTWRDKTFCIDMNTRYSSEPSIWSKPYKMVDQNLYPRLKRLFKNINSVKKLNENPDELIDIANFCAMIWAHKTGIVGEARGA